MVLAGSVVGERGLSLMYTTSEELGDLIDLGLGDDIRRKGHIFFTLRS
jgi:hypothetical protein